MPNEERKFLADIQEAVSGYNCTFNTHHDDGQFCVDVVVDEEDWKVASDQIQKALLDVSPFGAVPWIPRRTPTTWVPILPDRSGIRPESGFIR